MAGTTDAGAGYDRAFVDEAGNAVGEMGPADAARTVILLGHIDTVPGNIPVRIEPAPDGDVLYGRGSVDAKGPLATFAAAVARGRQPVGARKHVRLVVVGAVEEEAASSKGARFIRDRFDGVQERQPIACIIGEPSHWTRVTLGYKGRLLVELEAAQPMAHTAGPDAGVATVAVDFWNWLSDYAARFNRAATRPLTNCCPACAAWPPSPTTPCTTTSSPAAAFACRWTSTRIGLPRIFTVGGRKSGTGETTREGERERGNPQRRQPPSNPQSPISNLPLSPSPPLPISPSPSPPNTPPKPPSAARSPPSPCASAPTSRPGAAIAAIRSCAAFWPRCARSRPAERLGFVLKTGTSDMNVVGPAWSCPIVAYGPGDSSLDHTPHEHLPLDDYWRAVLVLESALRTLAQIA